MTEELDRLKFIRKNNSQEEYLGKRRQQPFKIMMLKPLLVFTAMKDERQNVCH